MLSLSNGGLRHLAGGGWLIPPGGSRLAGNLAPPFRGKCLGASMAALGSLRRGIRWRRIGNLASANVYNALGKLVEVAWPVHSHSSVVRW